MTTRKFPELPEKFLVAFSFAGEQRDLVRQIAEAVEQKLGPSSVFFDEWFEHVLAGNDADLKLQEIYHKQCELAIVCVSKRYGEKPWTKIEHQVIRARQIQLNSSKVEKDEHRILLIRVGDGDGDIPGILFNTIVPDIRERSIDYSVDLIIDRLNLIVPEAEQQKRVKTYVPTFEHDVFISFADEDSEWSNTLINYLHKQLKQKLETADGFRLYSGNDFSQLERAATLLLIAAPAYCQQYADQFAQLEQFAKQQSVFLVEKDICNPRPKCLKGFTPYRFWDYQDTEGMVPIADDKYFAKADELITAIAKQLIELKAQYQHQQQLQEQRRQQQENKLPSTRGVDAFVFLHSAPEDLDLAAQIIPLLNEYGIEYVLSLKRTIETTADDICRDIQRNIIDCDAVLILYEQTTPIWVREQLGTCRRLQRKRETPLKVIAVHKGEGKQDLDCQLNNLHIYCCPPEKIQSYLPRFIKTLIQPPSSLINKSAISNRQTP
jgi:hypothetical protein